MPTPSSRTSSDERGVVDLEARRRRASASRVPRSRSSAPPGRCGRRRSRAAGRARGSSTFERTRARRPGALLELAPPATRSPRPEPEIVEHARAELGGDPAHLLDDSSVSSDIAPVVRATRRAAAGGDAGAVRRTIQAMSILSAVSDCPSSSWISRAMPVRSSSRAASTCAERSRSWSSSCLRSIAIPASRDARAA